MMIVPAGVKVHLALGYTDMRKGMDGLAMLVQKVLKQATPLALRRPHPQLCSNCIDGQRPSKARTERLRSVATFLTVS